MSSVALAAGASGTGSVTLQAPATNNTDVITIPDTTGTMMVSGNMPAFSAYLSSNQTISSGTFTKVTINTKEFDTSNAFDATTNYRFTPQVAGYYQVSGQVYCSGTTFTEMLSSLYKNGSEFKRGSTLNLTAPLSGIFAAPVASLIYMNGSTDYIELWAYISASTSISVTGSQVTTYFSASLVRTA